MNLSLKLILVLGVSKIIAWFSQSRIRSFVKLSTKKQNKIKTELDLKFADQKQILNSRLSYAKDSARKADRLLSRGKKDKAKEAVNTFKLDLVSSQPIMNAYVSTSLEKHLLEVMSMEGFEFPDLLEDIRKDIDFGLFSVNASNELDAIINTEIDPFSELGIEL